MAEMTDMELRLRYILQRMFSLGLDIKHFLSHYGEDELDEEDWLVVQDLKDHLLGDKDSAFPQGDQAYVVLMQLLKRIEKGGE